MEPGALSGFDLRRAAQRLRRWCVLSPPKRSLTVSQPLPLTVLFRDYYQPQRLVDASDGCIRQYNINIAKLSKLLGRDALTADLTDENLSRLLAHERGRGRSPATCNKIRSQLVALWNFAARKKLADEFPDVSKLKEFKREPTSWTVEQVRKLWQTCDLMPGYVDGIPARLWWRGLLMVVYDTGARIGAVLCTPRSNFQSAEQQLLIAAEVQKHKADQVYSLHPSTVNVLLALDDASPQGTTRELLFPWEWSRSLLYKEYKALLKQAELPHSRRDKFHRIRRTTATLIEAAGGNATKLLGHSSRQVTEAHYLDSSKLPGFDIAAKLPRPEPQRDQPQRTALAHLRESQFRIGEACAQLRLLPDTPAAEACGRRASELYDAIQALEADVQRIAAR